MHNTSFFVELSVWALFIVGNSQLTLKLLIKCSSILPECLDIGMPLGRAHLRYCAHIRSLLESHLEAGVWLRDIACFM